MEGNALVLDLVPAYVHHWERAAGGWRGVGRAQAARIRLSDARIPLPLPIGAIEIDTHDDLAPHQP